LNRAGLTRIQEQARRRQRQARRLLHIDEHDGLDDEEREEQARGDEEWSVIRYLTPEARRAVNRFQNRYQGSDHDVALRHFRTHLFELRGLRFDGLWDGDGDDGVLDGNRDNDVWDSSGDDTHSNPDADHANEANPWPIDGAWPADIHRPATPIARPPIPLPFMRDESLPPPDSGEAGQGVSEVGFERPDWFPPIEGWPEDEEL
jgi:hypothetical protein